MHRGSKLEAADSGRMSPRVVLLGELSGTFVQEFKQSLTAMLSSARMLERILSESEPDLDAARAVVRSITEDSVRASDLVRDVRNRLIRGRSVAHAAEDAIDVNAMTEPSGSSAVI